MTPAYLDHASATPMRPEAVAAMLPFLTERFGNPSGDHQVARQARRALDEARETVADCLGCRPGEIVFTGGGTESNNLGVLGAQRTRGGRVVCSAVEHAAVLEACRAAAGTTVAVDGEARVDLERLTAALDDTVAVVSVMAVNNETGTIEPLSAVAEVVRRRAPGAVLHTDAVAAVPWLDVAEAIAPADLVSLSGHKFGGPRGVGILVVREPATVAPVLRGGPQERGRRPGTHDLAGIVGTAAALTAALSGRAVEVARVGALRDRLADGLVGAGTELVETVTRSAPHRDRSHTVAGTFHVLFPGVDQEELLLLADEAGVCAAAGAACASGALEPSHVLLALGLSAAEARTGLRFSLGHTTTAADVDTAVAVVSGAVKHLRDAGRRPATPQPPSTL